MTTQHQNPRILVVTPEVTFVPHGMGSGSRSISARAGGLGDICAAQVHTLYERGVDVHLAMPNYRNVFKINTQRMPGIDIHNRQPHLPESRIHLAQDRSFYYHPKLFLTLNWENIRIALAFQREVINRIIPEVQPDLIHCYDWMTGLIPAMACKNGIPCLFTLYRLESPRLLLSTMKCRGSGQANIPILLSIHSKTTGSFLLFRPFRHQKEPCRTPGAPGVRSLLPSSEHDGQWQNCASAF